MKRCFIITAYIEGGLTKELKSTLNISLEDFVLCADGGYKFISEGLIAPNLVIGDFDSFNGEIPQAVDKVSYPSEKDDTDTMLCVKYAVENDFDEIHIVGGIGGRLDHTLSNLQSMAWAVDFWQAKHLTGKKISIQDSQNHVMLISNDSIELNGTPGEKVSLVSYSDKCTGVSISPAKWPLTNVVLTSSFPLGISNEFLSRTCRISVDTGKLLIIRSTE